MYYISIHYCIFNDKNINLFFLTCFKIHEYKRYSKGTGTDLAVLTSLGTLLHRPVGAWPGASDLLDCLVLLEISLHKSADRTFCQLNNRPPQLPPPLGWARTQRARLNVLTTEYRYNQTQIRDIILKQLFLVKCCALTDLNYN